MTSPSSSEAPGVLLVLACLLSVGACQRGTDSPDDVIDGGSGCTTCGTGGSSSGTGGSTQPGSGGSDSGTGGRFGVITDGKFELVDDFDGPCEAKDVIDVNLGHTATSAVRALHCQIHGTEPPDDVLTERARALTQVETVRRIDVARGFCQTAGRTCTWNYSDPWRAQVALEETCQRKTTRDLGAVFMFFSDCPNGVNCSMDWANTHAHGMAFPHVLYGFGSVTAGYYNPGNAGFWQRELLDARWAGLQFLLLNVYGPDLSAEPYALAQLTKALDEIGGGIQIALFDDSWIWGRGGEEPWATAPHFHDVEGAAQKIYQNKWKPFFEGVPAAHWYTYDSRPFVYFYNAGTLEPLDSSAPVVNRLKELFAADFGVAPFVAVDSAFFADDSMGAVADARFTWDTFRDGNWSQHQLSGVTLDHAMVRWDSVGRDRPGELATPSDRMHKGPELLEAFLNDSADADIAVIATWNDLGEGTGIGRNYDYFSGDRWLPPHAFMSMTRAAQCED